jgi:hypothetical protein
MSNFYATRVRLALLQYAQDESVHSEAMKLDPVRGSFQLEAWYPMQEALSRKRPPELPFGGLHCCFDDFSRLSLAARLFSLPLNLRNFPFGSTDFFLVHLKRID